MLRLDPFGDFDSVIEEMKEAINEVDTGEVTVATRSVEINNVNVNQGEAIALLNSQLICSSKTIESATVELLSKAELDDRERLNFLLRRFDFQK